MNENIYVFIIIFILFLWMLILAVQCLGLFIEAIQLYLKKNEDKLT